MMSTLSYIWILIEGSLHSKKINLSSGASTQQYADLDCLAPILISSFKKLDQVAPEELEFFTSNDPVNPILKDTPLASLMTAAINPLIVRYPLSDNTGN
jgi:hypothetical protein